jgi:hypothetical protein
MKFGDICGLCMGKKVGQEPVKLCKKCFEVNAVKRQCCNAVFCDHCYTKDKVCPNCKQATRQEKMTGATYTLQVYSEHEECRNCLDPGLKRRCCGNYYCDECYFAQPNCRSCGTPVGDKGIRFTFSRAAIVSIVIGWATTAFIALVVVALVVTLLASESQRPEGIYGNQCYGFFKTCDRTVCINMDRNVSQGTQPLPDLSTWEDCDLDSLVRLRATACVYDEQLYELSDKAYGFEVCDSEFNEAVTVFEDDFENWEDSTFDSNLQRSALWADIVNADPNVFCGVDSDGGTKALTFFGNNLRYAETQNLDMSTGGWLEGLLFIAPLGYDFTNPFCKTSYTGNIKVLYSLNDGETWEQLFFFDSLVFQQSEYFPFRVDLTQNASSHSVRFRFQQPTFAGDRDGWALDNLKIYKYLPNDWQTSAAFVDVKEQSDENIGDLQCCYDTDWCTRRLSVDGMDECADRGDSGVFQLRLAEFYILMVVLLNVLKFAYLAGYEWFARKRYPFQDEIEDICSLERIQRHLPPAWRPKKSLTDIAENAHELARLRDDELKGDLKEEEGAGDIIKSEDERKAERKLEKEQRRRRQLRMKKKIEKRNAYKMARRVNITELEPVPTVDDDGDSDEDGEKKDPDKEAVRFGSEQMASEIDRFKRQSLAMLRVPYEVKVSERWRFTFAGITIGAFVVIFLFLASTTQYYSVHQEITPYGDGSLAQDVVLTSFGINFFAFVCDLKEVYFALKYVVPLRDAWTPLVTIDRTEDINSLFIGPHTILLGDVSSVNIFPKTATRLCAAAYVLGCFPWCMFSLVIRNTLLHFAAMRIVTPALGFFTLLRAVLGPGLLVKFAYSLRYVFSYTMYTRETVGQACQSDKTKLTAAHATLGLTLFGTFLGTIVAFEYMGWIFLGLLVGGFIFGASIGFTHELAIHPWMYLTTLDEGFTITLKKNRKCPCKHNFAYCTEMHQFTEVFLIFTREDVRFVQMVKGGSNT